MGRYGFKSGYIEAQNMDAGSATLDGTTAVSVSFDEVMQGVPNVVVTPMDSTTGTVYVQNITSSGFEVVSGDDDDDEEVQYLAFDDKRRE